MKKVENDPNFSASAISLKENNTEGDVCMSSFDINSLNEMLCMSGNSQSVHGLSTLDVNSLNELFCSAQRQQLTTPSTGLCEVEVDPFNTEVEKLLKFGCLWNTSLSSYKGRNAKNNARQKLSNLFK